jgi:hypothetical protein
MSTPDECHCGDQERRCIQCRSPFTWTAGEQRFYTGRGFPPPRRCQQCRDWNRQQRADGRNPALFRAT